MIAVPPRSARFARLVGGCLLVTALAAGLASCSTSASPATPSPSMGVVQDRAIPGTVPLVDQNGTPTSLSALKGKYVVLAPFLSLCQDECPLVTGAFLALQRDVRAAGLGNQVVFVEMTVDPGRDSPQRLAAYSQRFGADWTLLTGTPANLATLWSFFHVSYQIVPEAQPAKLDWWTATPLTYDVDHTDGYILIDRSGHERFITASAPNLDGKLSANLKSLLNAGGLQNLDHQQQPAWTVQDALNTLSWLVGRTIPPAGS
jgi:cytochrome oxidase Cu insertion factor (SCO1/SenC/PrrC family)